MHHEHDLDGVGGCHHILLYYSAYAESGISLNNAECGSVADHNASWCSLEFQEVMISMCR